MEEDISMLQLYVAVRVRIFLTCGGFGYGAFPRVLFGWLKKKCLASRYCVGCLGFNSFEGCVYMSKRELIDYICKINRSAKPEFLANFTEEELNDYLEHLMELDLEELAVCS